LETLPQLIETTLATERETAFAERLGAPAWTHTSSSRMRARVRALARALVLAGVGPGDRVAIVANNRVDWLVASFGILLAGGVTVPIFATLALDQMEFIFRDSEAKLCFVETAADAERLGRACPSAPRFIVFDGAGPDSLAALEAIGDAGAASGTSDLPGLAPAVGPHDLAVLIYTSGTTGDPKGVQLTHGNLVSNAVACAGLLPAGLGRGAAPVLSVLPFAHIYEHTQILMYLVIGASVYVTQPDYLLEDLRDVRPCTAAMVPRILERVLAGTTARARATGGLQAKLVPWALDVGRRHATAAVAGKRNGPLLELQYALAKRLVLSKIVRRLGLDRVEFFVTGSAPLHRDVALTFVGMGIPVGEGYGLTETAPVVTSNPLDAIRYGTVGKPIPGVSVKLADDGELLVKGPNVMRGYYHRPDDAPFTEDGWFKTGDIAEIDADGYVSITDRKKELIKTSAGKYVAPSRVEAALKRSPYVGNAFVIGDGRPYPIALISPNWDLVRAHFGIANGESTAAIAARADVKALVEREVIRESADLASFEAIRRIALLPRDLSIENGELSPTMKIKRRVVERTFAELIDKAYAER
jgi:long-chain acyl-CoA synthetase